MSDSIQSDVFQRYARYLSEIQPAQMQSALRAVIAAECLAKSTNEINFDDKSFAHSLSVQHRTLQQSVMRAFVAFANQLADYYEQRNYDLRNEAACQLANEICKLDLELHLI
jgi:hypothetical protein